MSDHIVGMMFNHNEGDILEEIITKAIRNVDSLFIADDGSNDRSWAIIDYLSKKHKDRIEYTAKRDRNLRDKGQRQHLLDTIRERYKAENTWVQIIESDIIILDTDIKSAIREHSVHDLAMSWMCINAARKYGTWKEVDTYPNWDMPMTELMPYAHWMEFMLYTFRPLPRLHYADHWRPWPSGFSAYTDKQVKGSYGRKPSAPLLLHVGYRGPSHFHKKYVGKWANDKHPKYPWDVSSAKAVEDTCFFFNGQWNNNELFEASRKGWSAWRRG